MVSLPTPTQKISHPLLSEKQIQLFVKRDDLIHREIMGNKWRKLRYNLEEMKQKGIDSLITMGGAYSNHIAATAAAAKEHNVKAIGIIRGEELNEVSNPTLQFAHDKGMELHFVDRTKFRKLRNNPEQIKKFYPNHYFLPEGGTNELAVKGCEEIIPEIFVHFDMIVTPIGTGGTFAGLAKSAQENQQIMGISSLKGDFIFNEISELLKKFKIQNKNCIQNRTNPLSSISEDLLYFFWITHSGTKSHGSITQINAFLRRAIF